MRALLLGAVLLADPTPVYAGRSCGGGSSGGSSSGGSSSGGSSSGGSSSGGSDSGWSHSSSSSGVDTTPNTGCIDDTDVHGFRKCTKFGTWGNSTRLPRIWVELGTSMRSFDTSLSDHSGSITHGSESFAYRVTMPAADPQRDVAAMTTARFGFGINRHFYSGLEAEIGGIVAPAHARTEMTGTGNFGAPVVEQGRGLVVGFTGVGGYRASSKLGSLALEGAGGLRSVRYSFDSSYHNCETTETIAVTRGVVEARARGELWLNPWVTLGASLGTNVLAKNDWSAGLFFGFHSRAFAGSR